MPKSLYSLLILILSASSLMAQSPTPTASSDACKRFVQQFYDWYLAKDNAMMNSNNQESVFEVTLREKRSSFSSGLMKALEEDLAASKKSPDEIVGLDFDPFLNAQDTPERYVVGAVRTKDDHYLVEVFGFWNGRKNSKPDLIPELALENGKWIFTNFHYEKSDIPANENLVSVLQQLKKDREKTTK